MVMNNWQGIHHPQQNLAKLFYSLHMSICNIQITHNIQYNMYKVNCSLSGTTSTPNPMEL